MFKELGNFIGTLTGAVLGVPLAIIAETLQIPIEAVKAAKEAGCETYEEIREFFNSNY